MSRSRRLRQLRSRTTATRLVLVATLAITVAWFTGCGGGDEPSNRPTTVATTASSALAGLSADEVLAKARDAARAATSVHAAGAGTSDGDALRIDLRLKAGDGGTGTIGVGGVTLEIVVKGQDLYFKADEDFFKNALGAAYTAQVAQLIDGKFLKGAISDPRFGDFANFADMRAFMESTLKPDGAITRVDGKPIGGIPTVGLNDKAADGGTMYVADDGTNLPLALEPGSSGGGTSGSITFSEWNATFDITPPPDDQVVDISKLG